MMVVFAQTHASTGFRILLKCWPCTIQCLSLLKTFLMMAIVIAKLAAMRQSVRNLYVRKSLLLIIYFAGARNDLLDVEVRQKGTNGVEVLCRLLSRFKGTANCEVMYTVYTVLPYHTVKSERIGGAEDVIIVFLSESFEPNTLVTLETYTVGGKQDAKVLGVFTAGTNQLLFYISTIIHSKRENRDGVKRSKTRLGWMHVTLTINNHMSKYIVT